EPLALAALGSRDARSSSRPGVPGLRPRPEPLAPVDEQRLIRAADRATLVVQRRLGGADAVWLRVGRSFEAHPLPFGHPRQMNAEVDVDEQEALPIESGADAIAGVGG